VTLFARLAAFLAVGRPQAPSAPPALPPGAIPVVAVGEAPQAPPAAPLPMADRAAIPTAAVDIVGRWEGFRADAYLCPAKVWTIGYGTTRWGDRRPVQQGDGPVTEAEARKLLMHDLHAAAMAVDGLVTVELTEHQRAALISFVYNVGQGAFARSTMLRHLNAGRMDSAAGEFTRWINAGGVQVQGLVRRRAEEATLFKGR